VYIHKKLLILRIIAPIIVTLYGSTIFSFCQQNASFSAILGCKQIVNNKISVLSLKEARGFPGLLCNYSSTTGASGAFLRTEAMPFSQAALVV
jgi:hypothetical protein